MGDQKRYVYGKVIKSVSICEPKVRMIAWRHYEYEDNGKQMSGIAIYPVIAIQTALVAHAEISFVPCRDEKGVVTNTPKADYLTLTEFRDNGFRIRPFEIERSPVVLDNTYDLVTLDELKSVDGATCQMMIADWTSEQDESRVKAYIEQLKLSH